ncbi:MAG: hypothetical protein ABFD91_17710 [Anaerohalosphaeraceae bacterium]
MRQYPRMMTWFMVVLLLGGMLLGGHIGPLTDNSEKSTEAGIRAAVVSVPLVIYDQSHSRVRTGGDLSLSGWFGLPVIGLYRMPILGYFCRTFSHSSNSLESTLISLDCRLQI